MRNNSYTGICRSIFLSAGYQKCSLRLSKITIFVKNILRYIHNKLCKSFFTFNINYRIRGHQQNVFISSTFRRNNNSSFFKDITISGSILC